MADIKQIKVGSTNYDIKDETARGIATTQIAGRVKPDGTTITVDNDGTIHSTGGGSDLPFSIVDGKVCITYEKEV